MEYCWPLVTCLRILRAHDVCRALRQKIEQEDQCDYLQGSGKTGIGFRGRDLKKALENKLEVAKNNNATMDVRSYEAGRVKKLKNKATTKRGKSQRMSRKGS